MIRRGLTPPPPFAGLRICLFLQVRTASTGGVRDYFISRAYSIWAVRTEPNSARTTQRRTARQDDASRNVVAVSAARASAARTNARRDPAETMAREHIR